MISAAYLFIISRKFYYLDESFRKLTESTPYVRPKFVPYTQPSQPFVPPHIPYIPPENTDPVIVNTKNNDKSVDFRKSGDYEKVLKSCDEALKADPKYLDGGNEKAEAEEVFIDWIKIGGIELKNVRAVLKQKGDNLLGQNVLGKLKISIQKENNINIMTLKK